MDVSSVGTQNLQDLGKALHKALDRNGDNQLDLEEFSSFLTSLLSSVSGGSGAWSSPYLPTTGQGTSVTTSPLTSLDGGTDTTVDTSTEKSTTARFGDWRDYIWGKNNSGKYEYMPVAPPDVKVSSEGYQAGPHRDQLEGFNFAKMDPNHQDGMVLKYVAARVFEQIDCYASDAAEQAVKIFNDLGIPAKVVDFDLIDFQNGEAPIDVIRTSPTEGGGETRGWQWLNTDGER